jgi:hypothetical protein
VPSVVVFLNHAFKIYSLDSATANASGGFMKWRFQKDPI